MSGRALASFGFLVSLYLCLFEDEASDALDGQCFSLLSSLELSLLKKSFTVLGGRPVRWWGFARD
jgi:hypothetical protein